VTGNRSAFSPIFFKIARDNLGFFNQATDPVPNGRMLFREPESGISREKLANGDIRVNVVCVIDDNKKESDGRILLKDEFILSGEGRTLKKFTRGFEYNGKGDSGLWKKRFAQYGLMQQPSNSEAQSFVDKVLVKEDWINLLKGPGKAAMDFLGSTYAHLEEIRGNKKMAFKFLESGTRVEVIDKTDRWDIKFTYVLDEDGDSKNGRILLEDYFKVKKKDFKLTSQVRRWALHPDSYGNSEFIDVVNALNQKSKPPTSEAQEFIKIMLPLLFSSQTPAKAAEPEKKAEAPKPLPKPAEKPAPKPEKPSAPQVSGNKFTFSSHPQSLDPNTTQDNISGRVNSAVKGYLSRRIRKLNVSKIKFKVLIHFNDKTGFVDRIEFSDVKVTGGSVPEKTLHSIFYEMSTRIHSNVRAQKGLRDMTVAIPYSLIAS